MEAAPPPPPPSLLPTVPSSLQAPKERHATCWTLASTLWPWDSCSACARCCCFLGKCWKTWSWEGIASGHCDQGLLQSMDTRTQREMVLFHGSLRALSSLWPSRGYLEGNQPPAPLVCTEEGWRCMYCSPVFDRLDSLGPCIQVLPQCTVFMLCLGRPPKKHEPSSQAVSVLSSSPLYTA